MRASLPPPPPPHIHPFARKRRVRMQGGSGCQGQTATCLLLSSSQRCILQRILLRGALKIGTEEDITAEQERGLEQRKSCTAKLHTAAILSACLNATCGFFLLFSLQKDCCVVPCPHPCITEITKMRFVCVCMCVCLRWRCCSCIS